MELMLAARRVRFCVATNFVATNRDLLDDAHVDEVDEFAEWNLIARSLRRLEEAPEEEDKNDDHHPEECGFHGGIQRICLQKSTPMLVACPVAFSQLRRDDPHSGHSSHAQFMLSILAMRSADV